MATLAARPLPRSLVAGDKRRSRRLKVFALAELIVEGRTLRAHVLDISPRGSLLHVGGVHLAKVPAVLRLAGAPCTGTVIWSGAGRVGLEFTPPLTDDQVAAILTA